MPKNNAPDAVNATPDDAAELRAEVEQLKQEKEELNRQVFQLQLERDVLTVAAEVLKKDEGVSLCWRSDTCCKKPCKP